MKFRHYAVIAFSCTITMLSACGDKNEQSNDDSNTTYPITVLTQKDTLLDIQYVADLQATKNIEVRSRLDGLLSKIHIQEGQVVRRGQTLFTISNPELNIDLNKAIAKYRSVKADAEVAKVEVERVQLLVDNEVVAETELQLAKAKYNALLASVEVAQAEMDAVKKRISYSTIVAPFDGMVDRIPLKEGSLITQESLLTTISDISTMKAYFNISENEYYQLMKTGQLADDILEIKLVLPDGSLYAHHGTLAPAESEIDASTGNIAFKVLFSNPQSMLRHGTSGKILISRALDNALLVPQKAVFEIQDKNFVYILNNDSIVKMKSIQVSERLADLYLLKGGLQTGDRIVVEGIQTLKDGQKITPKL